MYIAPEHLREDGRKSTIPFPTVFEIVDKANKTIKKVPHPTNLSTSQVQPGSKHFVDGKERTVIDYNYGNTLITGYVPE